jgi:hypothetical protein
MIHQGDDGIRFEVDPIRQRADGIPGSGLCCRGKLVRRGGRQVSLQRPGDSAYFRCGAQSQRSHKQLQVHQKSGSTQERLTLQRRHTTGETGLDRAEVRQAGRERRLGESGG